MMQTGMKCHTNSGKKKKVLSFRLIYARRVYIAQKKYSLNLSRHED